MNKMREPRSEDLSKEHMKLFFMVQGDIDRLSYMGKEEKLHFTLLPTKELKDKYWRVIVAEQLSGLGKTIESLTVVGTSTDK